MFKFIRQITCYGLLILALANVLTVHAQDRVTIDRAIRFQRGKISSTVSGRISRGTSHIYRVRAREGQQMAVVLKTGNRTSFTISARSAGILEGADGVRQTLVELPETGEYEILIGTDATANYSLEVTIK
jgi:hypothetical protein